MIDLPLHKELRAAEQIVHRAALLTKSLLSSATPLPKADLSPVTIADFAAQALITSSLHALFPHDSFVGEESSTALRQDPILRSRVHSLLASAGCGASEDEMLDSIDLGGNGVGGGEGRFWVMDPVDGTATFLRGEQYAVALALVQDGREVLGVVCYPNLRLEGGRVREGSVDEAGMGVMLSAVKGQGAMLRVLENLGNTDSHGDLLPLPEPQPLPRLTPPATLSELHVVDCEASPGAFPGLARRVMEGVGAAYPGTDVWSSHVRYAALILGGGHVLLRVPKRGARSWIWDHAGAQLIFREMGGTVTDLEGGDVDFGRGRALDGNWGLVAAVGEIHGEVLAMVREVMAKD